MREQITTCNLFSHDRAQRIFFLDPNTNTNIFGMFVLTRIRIRIYSGSYSGPNTNTNIFVIQKWTEYEYSNIFDSNIQISSLLNIRIFHGPLLQVLNFAFSEQCQIKASTYFRFKSGLLGPICHVRVQLASFKLHFLHQWNSNIFIRNLRIFEYIRTLTF